MIIRSASTEDAPSISLLLTSLSRRFITCDFSPSGESKFLSSVDESAIRRLFDAGLEYFVAEEHSQIVGVVGFRGKTHLFHLFVAESLHGSGLGRRLWLHGREKVVPFNFVGELTVNSSRNAVGFYERLGFARVGGLDERDGVISVPMRLNLHAA